MLVVAAFGIISAISGVDVDRYYLPELPIVLNNFFWFLMLSTTMCIVWESVRHWGSWQERQLVDPDPFSLRQDDRRSKVEFWIPLVFYFFAWMVCAFSALSAMLTYAEFLYGYSTPLGSY